MSANGSFWTFGSSCPSHRGVGPTVVVLHPASSTARAAKNILDELINFVVDTVSASAGCQECRMSRPSFKAGVRTSQLSNFFKCQKILAVI